ncbi:MAG: 2-oxoglutarate dehydrogenase complex dihydrolipoyllysine-residue succinyltransferase [Geobacteraceae bacterium]|nr:2-oxoglutarate dehydrogenase complex dihydrolipoyllysine-residue succinyltransferase [Geobacteraceae bacterium]
MEIKIPEVGESVREALLAKWFRKNGELVKKDEPLCEIETDKITLDINADASGRLEIQTDAGTSVAIGAVVGMIIEQPAEEPISSGMSERQILTTDRPDGRISPASSPSIRREMREQGIVPNSVTGTGKGGRIMAGDLSTVKEAKVLQTPVTDERTAPQSSVATIDSARPRFSAAPESEAPPPVPAVRSEEAPSYNSSREVRKPMSPIRKRISEHLVAARQQTAMLTTFNEADLSRVKELRGKYSDHFQKRHGVPLGLMPFFVKACVEALKEYPSVNASIDGDDIVYHNFYDIGIAIGAEKGLVVPVLRNVDRMRMYEIDQAIAAFSEKIRTNHLAISDLEGGTFSISNGGVYGSMLSTPIINIPQSGVLGMHAIQDRPVARDGQVVIRPMMFLALSYDHRIIDGREAVGFLKMVKENIEEPEEFLLEG